MSRHIPRHDRWQRVGPIEYRSGAGLRVYFERGAWWADVSYRLRPEDESPEAVATWKEQTDRLGPFKRPRNAKWRPNGTPRFSRAATATTLNSDRNRDWSRSRLSGYC